MRIESVDLDSNRMSLSMREGFGGSRWLQMAPDGVMVGAFPKQGFLWVMVNCLVVSNIFYFHNIWDNPSH